MAVVFGDKKTEDGWLRVTCIQWQMDKHENGYSVDAKDIPDYPVLARGKMPVQMYHPEKNEWRFDEIDVPLTKEQILEELVDAVRELTAVLKERK
jgi:hypothetical protein